VGAGLSRVLQSHLNVFYHSFFRIFSLHDRRCNTFYFRTFFLEVLVSVYLPPLQAMHDSQVFISGDVTIDPNAAIAPGVLLQASAGSSITIAAGVCIGMGAVLHACDGTLEIQSGASLGAGVLVVGTGTIGPNACIGSQSTLLNTSVEGQILVPAGSVLGDRSRQIQLDTELASPEVTPEPTPSEAAGSDAAPTPTPSFQSPESPQNGSSGSSSFQYPERPSIGANPFKYPEPQSLDLGKATEQNGQPEEEKAPPYKATNIVRPESTSSD
jgi:carbon dioxide concentrating mechanism protein CcmN